MHKPKDQLWRIAIIVLGLVLLSSSVSAKQGINKPKMPAVTLVDNP